MVRGVGGVGPHQARLPRKLMQVRLNGLTMTCGICSFWIGGSESPLSTGLVGTVGVGVTRVGRYSRHLPTAT